MLQTLFSQKYEISTETKNILKLIRTENIGIKTFYNIYNYYGSASIAVKYLPDFLAKIGKKNITLCKDELIEQELEKMANEKAKFVHFSEPHYPNLLRHIYDKPPIISYKGRIDLASRQCVAIVGSRNCSLAGMQLTRQLSTALTKAGICVVSGLARGIDTEAHKASLPSTIAVIAGGIGNIYPPENHKLYKQIEEESLLIAELPIGTAPHAKHFPQRNRIISGLSSACLIIEASLNSGSLITAKYALEQNREIFACPGFPLDPRHKGTNKLIKEGANILDSIDDVIEFYKKNDFLAAEDYRRIIQNNKEIHLTVDESLLTHDNKKQVLSCISAVPISTSEIILQTNLPASIVLNILLELELSAKIVYQPDNRIVLNYTNI